MDGGNFPVRKYKDHFCKTSETTLRRFSCKNVTYVFAQQVASSNTPATVNRRGRKKNVCFDI